jgi:hypothetical protein
MVKRWLKDWTLLIGGTVFILAGLLTLAMPYGIIPAHLQTDGYSRSIHWVVVAYIRLSAPILGLSMIACAILFAATIVRIENRERWATIALLAFWLSLLAVVLSVYSISPLLFVGYEPIASLETIDFKYHLGMRTAFDGDYFWVISKCDRWNISCEYRGIISVEEEEKSQMENTYLECGRNINLLTIRTPQRTISATDFEQPCAGATNATSMANKLNAADS